MNKSLTFVSVALVAASSLLPFLAASAEKAPRGPAKLRSDATHVVTGSVQAIYSRREQTKDWTYNRYVAELLVTRVEKGKDLKRGAVAYVRYWTREYRGLFSPDSTLGHSPLPKPGENVRVFAVRHADDGYGAVRKDGGLDALGPNGFERLRDSQKR